MLIIRQDDSLVSYWTGGISNQWLIYPPNSTLENRDFSFRISTASVKEEQSVFSFFDDYKRFLIPISGHLNLEHEMDLGIFNQTLKPFQLGCFDGGWTTKATGLFTDFNLIIQKEINASIHLIEIEENIKHKPIASHFKVFFLAVGIVRFLDEEILAPCLFQLDQDEEFNVSAVEHSKIIAVSLNNSAF